MPLGRGRGGFERWGLRALLRPDYVLPQTGQLEPLLSRFTEEEELQMTRMLQRMDILAKVEDPGTCPEKGPRVSPDPSQTLCPTPAPLRKPRRWACG